MTYGLSTSGAGKRICPRASALARLSDKAFYLLFKGNHDAWLRGYLEEEIGLLLSMIIRCFPTGAPPFLRTEMEKVEIWAISG